jgi:putative inorganic carbon (hco3(-)) transporter
LENFTLNIDPSNNQPKRSIGKFLRRKLLIDKYSGWFIFLLFIILSTSLAYATAVYGMMVGIFTIISLVTPLLVYFIIVNPEFGIIVYLTLAYTMMWLSRYLIESFPLGTLMDGMLVLFILGLFIQMKQKKEWQVFNNNISILILIWVLYNLMQVVNPAAESKLAWLYTVRTMALVTLMYFIFVFNIRSKKFIKTILKWWIIWSFIAACYAFKQEYFGFDSVEQKWLDSSPVLTGLLFLAGHWRKFSMFSDPVTFAYNMATASILCMALITGPMKTYKKVILGFLAFFFLYAMIFSGTRGANPLIPVALILFAILKFNKKILMFTAAAFLFLGFLIVLPTSNQNILRFQTAFRPKQDASYQLREENQAKIKPYVYSHPFGGGLGATGEWGARFSPNSYLGTFQPDSGYVRTTVELGWVGLLLFSLMVFVILKTGINNYFKIIDPQLKSYSLAVVLIVFIWNIGNFPQQAIVQYPSNVLFFLAVALMVAIYRIDQQQNLAVDGKS